MLCMYCLLCGDCWIWSVKEENEFGRSKLVVPRLNQVASSCLPGSEQLTRSLQHFLICS